jgi:heparanase 1
MKGNDMNRNIHAGFVACAALMVIGNAMGFAAPPATPSASVTPQIMPRIGTVDERFQSYNIEMVEVTGGRFWRPYASAAAATPANANQPTGMDPSLYEYRKPIDLYNPRLRKLASALGPAYVRVSGTWANSTFFQPADGSPPAEAPAGFKGVLTRDQWKGVVEFSKATDAKIVTSFAISPGTRDGEGAWTPEQARQILAYTKSLGGSIAAAELMNEPTMPQMGGAPKDYDAAAFARDVKAFRDFARSADAKMLVLGPGSVGEGANSKILVPGLKIMKSEDMLTATGPAFDVFSYHTYGAVSVRCKSMGADATTTQNAALSEEWLSRGDQSEQFYAGLRDLYEPGTPMWNTETAQAACGGDRWASTFLDSFRYLNQLGDLAKRGVQVHMHNTLAASDYGLLQENTFEPRPNYWAALLWRRFMGTTVLDPGTSPASSLHVYAHCLRNHPGGVALLVINADANQKQSLAVNTSSERYTLTGQTLTDKQAQLNGVDLKLGADDALPKLMSIETKPGDITFAPASITFLAFPGARNTSCER